MVSQHLSAARPANVPAERVVDFDMFNPFSDEQDFHKSWLRLREDSPFNMVWTPYNEGHWIALDPELISTVYADAERFSSRIVLVPKSTSGAAYGEFIPLSLDPPRHRPYRNILNGKLHGAAVDPLEDGVRELTVSLIESFAGNKRCNFVHDFAEQLPLRVFMKLVDLPVEDLPRLKHLADQFTRPDGSMTPEEASKAFRDYLVPIMASRKGSGRSDLLTHIGEGMIGDRAITDAEAMNMAVQTLVGGLDTVVNFMSFAMLTLSRLPDVQARIVGDSSIIPAVVNELLRRLPLVSSGRETIKDVVVDGVTLRAGDMVVSPTPLYSLSPKSNERPLEFDVDRPLKKHITFGSGHHICPGQFIARMEMKILLEEWFKRIPKFWLAAGQVVRHRGGTVGGTDPYALEWE